jgi:malonyl-CoA O-methyltransferase
MTPVRSISARFSAAAARYDDDADVQKAAAARLVSMIPASVSPRRVLDLGCGSGQLTRLLRERWPDADLVAVDVATGMIAAAKERLARDLHVKWIVGDAMTYREDRPYDLVASNCALHWLHPLAEGLRNVASLVSPGGRLACSVMLDGTLRELRDSRRLAAPAKPPLADMPSRAAVASAIALSGLNLRSAACESHAAAAPSAGAVLRTVRAQGFTGGELSRGRAPLVRGELRRLEELYNRDHRSADGSVSVTYEIGYFLAERP